MELAETTSADLPHLNGDQHDTNTTSTDVSNTGAFAENAAITVAPGITPVANFIPKDAPTSHPTPPPDEPLATSEANVDLDTKADEDSKPADQAVEEPVSAISEPAVAPATFSSESSLVRPREEDDDGEDDEPAAKRGKFEGDASEDVVLPDIPAADAPNSAPSDSAVDPTITGSADVTMESQPLDAPTVAQSESALEPSSAPALEPESEPVPHPATEEPVATTDVVMETQSSDAPAVLPKNGQPTPVESFDAKVEPAENGELDAQQHQQPVGTDSKQDEVKPEEAKPVETQSQETSQPPAAPAAAAPTVAAPAKHSYSKETLTTIQTRFLLEKMKNLKKTKNSVAFLNPVDPVALNIPTYTEIVKNPMDLNTMENKLKTAKYESVQGFADDFDLIIGNARKFNGDAHPVTQAGLAMEAYFRKMMEGVPSANQPTAQPKVQPPKKASPKPQPRRESRQVTQVTAPPPAPASATTAPANSAESFALQADGTPQIRRDSTINRPARAIKPPPARELAYSKPKRKEHQLELKFCDHVLNEIKGPKYGGLNHVFLQPVDPVALNIPHYRQVVKHPMDLASMTQKLKQGQYGKAGEFKKDFELMITNCLAFNPAGNPVRDLGIQFKREFEALWNTKEKWEKARKAESQRGTSASADDDSGEEEEEEEEEEEGGDDKSTTILALQKQLKEIQSALAGIDKRPKQKKAKTAAAKPSKKAGGSSAPAKAKPAPKSKPTKKPKQVTYEEKQEISDAVGRMDEAQVNTLTKIITDNCKKYADQEEMELEIDDLPNDVQAMLLTYVRKIFGNPNRGARAASPDDAAAMDDDDFEPERGGRRSGGGGSKKKKHKPMHKEEQQKAINDIQRQLAQFQNPTSASPSQQEDTSGDESEESEEE